MPPRKPLTLDEFYEQIQALRKMAGSPKILTSLPGKLGQVVGTIDSKELKNLEAILAAMTVEERNNFDLLLDEPPRKRISETSGRPLQEVNDLISQFHDARRLTQGGDG